MQSVEKAYDGAKQHSLEERRQLDTYPLQVVNNRVKHYLISRVLGQGQRILDMGCGKGGDGHRILGCRPAKYVGFDISRVSIEEAVRRHAQLGAQYFTGDMLTPDTFTSAQVVAARPFDVINSQFCLHYVWPHLDVVLRNMDNAKVARRGTVWVGTLVDDLALTQFKNEDGGVAKITDLTKTDYLFSMPPLVEARESIVPFTEFVQTMQQYDWRLAETRLFRDLHYGDSLSSHLMAVYHLYRTFAFVKS